MSGRNSPLRFKLRGDPLDRTMQMVLPGLLLFILAGIAWLLLS
jgi:hypothetical protein